jgi:hypothetical protein
MSGLGNKLPQFIDIGPFPLIPQFQRCCGFWVHFFDVRHSLDSAMEPLHPREVAIKELGPAKADEKFFDTCIVCGPTWPEPVIGAPRINLELRYVNNKDSTFL